MKTVTKAEPEQDVTESRRTNFESWWRTQTATMALLKHAYSQISGAEERISAMERRIRELEDLAATDPLTGLMNRRGFEKFFEQELERIRRHNSPGSLLVLIDLDQFKSINDAYGHQAGDACLKLAGEKLLNSIRILDGAARFGGDEFALLLTQTNPEKALPRVQKIKKILNDMRLEWQGQQLHFGASVGVEPVTAASSYNSAYRHADGNLYADKKRRQDLA